MRCIIWKWKIANAIHNTNMMIIRIHSFFCFLLFLFYHESRRSTFVFTYFTIILVMNAVCVPQNVNFERKSVWQSEFSMVLRCSLKLAKWCTCCCCYIHFILYIAAAAAIFGIWTCINWNSQFFVFRLYFDLSYYIRSKITSLNGFFPVSMHHCFVLLSLTAFITLLS